MIQFGIKSALTLILLPGLFLLALAFRQQPPKPNNQPSKPTPAKLTSHVMLISISGLSSDLLDKASAETPTIRELRSKCASAVSLESIFPAFKLPNHASLITGMLPADHGVLADFPFDEQAGAQSLEPFQSLPAKKSDTLWEAARREKLLTAAIGFPLTVVAPIDFNFPDQFKAVAPEAQLGLIDSARVAQAVRTIKESRPNLLALNFASLELTQRKYGVESKETSQALRQIDAGIEQLIKAAIQAGINDEATWLILSDRGAAKIEREFSPNLLLKEKKLLEVDEKGSIKSWSATAAAGSGMAVIFAKTPQDEKLVAEVEKLFIEQHEKPDSPIWRIFTRDKIAKLGGDPRATLYLEAAPGWAFSSRTRGPVIAKPVDHAASGYLPSKFKMKGALILAGKGVKPGSRLEYARVIDIAPTVARLLDFELNITRGRVIQEALKQ